MRVGKKILFLRELWNTNIILYGPWSLFDVDVRDRYVAYRWKINDYILSAKKYCFRLGYQKVNDEKFLHFAISLC